MVTTKDEADWMIPQYNLTTARNLSPLFEEAVRGEQPIVITRGNRDQGLLLARAQLLRVLSRYRLHVDVIPEEEVGGFTLWLRELDLGEYGPTLQDARKQLLDGVRSYVRHYFQSLDLYRHLPDKSAQEPYVYRLSLARDDAELIEMLFGTNEHERDGENGVAPTAAVAG